MPNIHQSSGSLSAASLQSNANNLPTNSGSSSPNLNAVSSHTNGNNRIHPPLQERSRNARAQARHRAKRKAYILQLEETVARLQAALSPNPPFNTSYPSSGAGGGSNTSSNDQSHLSPGIPLSSPNTLPNTVIGIGPPPAAGQGSAGSGDGNNFAARLRALELECSAVRTYAETLRGMLGHHAPGVQVPPPPLPSSLQPSASATTTGPPSAHSGTSSSFSSGLGSGAGETLPPLNSTFPPAPTSSSPGSYRVDASEKVAGVKRPRRDSHSRSLSSSGSGTDREGGEGSGFSTGDGGNISYTTSKATPPLNNKPSASIVPIHGNFPHSGVNSYALANSGSHHPPLILPPIPPSQPAPLQPLASQATTHVTPPPPYTYGASQSQQPLSSPLTAHQHQHQHQHQQHPSHPQSQTTHTNTHSQPQMTPMPPPIPAWGSNVGVSSVPSHGNNSAHAQSLHLPPPIPRLNGTSSTMSSLTRSFAYPLNASPSSTRQEGMDGSSSTDRNRFGSFSGGGIGAGIGASGNANMVLKREDDHETSLPANMHASGRHQHHETIHSISPTSTTDTSPTSAIPQHQEHYHPQIPSPQGHQHTYQHQQSSATQRLLPSPVPHQHETQSHYSHHTSVPTISQPTQHQHAHLGHHHQAQPLHHHQQQQQHHQQQQQNTAAHGLPSPHSPYPPVSPNVSGEYRGYQEERYPHHQSSQQHTQTQAPHGHTHQQSQSQGQGQGQGQGQSQNHNENYLWPPAQAGAVYGGR